MFTQQAFIWKEKDPVRGDFKNRHYLLMPNEVEEFKRLTGPGIEFSFNQSFERMTGRSTDGMTALQLVVRYFPERE